MSVIIPEWNLSLSRQWHFLGIGQALDLTAWKTLSFGFYVLKVIFSIFTSKWWDGISVSVCIFISNFEDAFYDKLSGCAKESRFGEWIILKVATLVLSTFWLVIINTPPLSSIRVCSRRDRITCKFQERWLYITPEGEIIILEGYKLKQIDDCKYPSVVFR